MKKLKVTITQTEWWSQEIEVDGDFDISDVSALEAMYTDSGKLKDPHDMPEGYEGEITDREIDAEEI